MPFNLGNYMNKVAQTPDEYYRSLAQATITTQFDNTTQLRKIQEEDFPFKGEYTEFDVWVNSVSDVTTSTNKVIGNYIDILFDDINHRQNYRGTKYIYDNETYLTYDKLNHLNVVPSTKAIKCNNFLSFRTDLGKIIKEPVFIGWEITSTNSQISKEGTTENRRLVVLIQNNKNTESIKVNQRFILNHKRAFKVESIDDMQMENSTDVTLNTLYIAWDSILPTDDLENNLADGNNDVGYSISIPQGNILQTQGYVGNLTSITRHGDVVVDDPNVTWISSDISIVEVDNQGRYEILGLVGQTALITCISGLDSRARYSVYVGIVQDLEEDKRIIVEPEIKSISKLRSETLRTYVQVDGVKQSDTVNCTANWIDDRYYTLIETNTNEYKLTCKEKSNKPLILTFTSGDTEKQISIRLEGLL